MDRKQHWESVYTNKSPLEVSWYQTEPALSLDLIVTSGVARDAAIIDVGGGASVLVDRLLAAGYTNLSVLDISAQALAHARQRLGAAALRVAWLEADITQFDPPQTYRLWHDRAVFHFLTDAGDRRKYVEALKRGLAPGGQVVMAAFAIGGPLKCSNLDIVQYDTGKLSAELGTGFRLLETRSELHPTPSGKTQQFGYYRFVRQDSAPD
jgi:SAM-dependent methyltransferase